MLLRRNQQITVNPLHISLNERGGAVQPNWFSCRDFTEPNYQTVVPARLFWKIVSPPAFKLYPILATNNLTILYSHAPRTVRHNARAIIVVVRSLQVTIPDCTALGILKPHTRLIIYALSPGPESRI